MCPHPSKAGSGTQGEHPEKFGSNNIGFCSLYGTSSGAVYAENATGWFREDDSMLKNPAAARQPACFRNHHGLPIYAGLVGLYTGT